MILAESTFISKNRPGYSDPILIIEDSPSISMLIEEFLTTLGYYNIRISNLGNEGVQKFNELINSGMTPLVFLDYSAASGGAEGQAGSRTSLK